MWVGLAGTAGWVVCFVATIVAGLSGMMEVEQVALTPDTPAAVVDAIDTTGADAETVTVQDAIAGEDWEQVRQQIVADIEHEAAAVAEMPADPQDAQDEATDGDAGVGSLLAEVGLRSADGYLTVSLAEADRHLGGMAKLVQRDGREYYGLLVAANDARVLMEKPLGGGTFTAEFRADEIRSLSVIPAH
jgi:hypothetical protein